jgi:hypothetical protein
MDGPMSEPMSEQTRQALLPWLLVPYEEADDLDYIVARDRRDVVEGPEPRE